MSDPSGPSAEQRRRRRDRVFGEVLPDVTRDERPDARGAGSGSPEEEPDQSSDRWLREQVPPHHG